MNNELLGLDDETGRDDYEFLKEHIGARAVARRLRLNKDTPRGVERRWERGEEVDLRSIIAYRALRLAVALEEKIHAVIEDQGMIMGGDHLARFIHDFEGPFVGDYTMVLSEIRECLRYAESCGIESHETSTMRAALEGNR